MFIMPELSKCFHVANFRKERREKLNFTKNFLTYKCIFIHNLLLDKSPCIANKVRLTALL